MNTTLATVPGKEAAAAFEAKAQRAVAFANSFVIDSDEAYQLAAEELRGVKLRGNALEDERTKITVPMNAALQAVNDLFRGPKALFDSVEGIYKAKMIQWQARKDALAQAARREAEAVAKKERERLEAEAERVRREAEDVIAANKVSGEEADDRRRAAEAQANHLLAEAEVTVAQPLAVDKPRATGISTAKTLEATVANKFEFVEFIVKSWERDPGMLDYLSIDTVRLRAAVRTHGAKLNWPGIAVGDKSTIRVR